MMKKTGPMCLFISDLGGGGAQRMLVNLANQFAQKGQEVHLVVFQGIGDYWDILSPEIKIFILNKHGLGILLPFTKYLWKERPCSILSFMLTPNIIAIIANVLSLWQARLVISERITYSKVELNSLEWLTGKSLFAKNSLKKIFAKLFYPLADEIIAVSKAVAEDLEEYGGYRKGRVKYIYNPTITPELFVLAKEEPQHRWLNEDVPVILAVGRLNPQKNYSLLIEAFAELRKSLKAKLIILGDVFMPEEKEEKIKLVKLIDELGIKEDVDLAGFQKNPYAFMSRTDLFVLSSDFEGLPNVLIEALACAAPVGATDCASGPREILAGGKYGILVPVGDKDKLAAAMKSALHNLESHKKMTMDFQREAMQQFTREYAAEKYLDVLLKRESDRSPNGS